MYVTQFAQFSKYTAPQQTAVPLIANRQAEVRAFVIRAPSDSTLALPPPIRIKLNGLPFASLTAPPAFAKGLPRALTANHELNNGHSYNATFPEMRLSDGWDFSNGSVPNGAKMYDVMGYCTPYWIGAYDWGKVVTLFRSGPAPNAVNTATPADLHRLDSLAPDEMALHVFGIIDANGMRLSDAWTDFGSSFHETDPGPVTFVGLDARGDLLFSSTAQLFTVHPGGHFGLAELHIPIANSVATSLHELRMSYAGKSVLQVAFPGGQPMATASAVDSDHVRVTFDGTKFLSLTIRPSNQSADNVSFVDGDGTPHSTGVIESNVSELYIDFQDGVKTVARAVNVHVVGR